MKTFATKTLCVLGLALTLAGCGKKSKKPPAGEAGEGGGEGGGATALQPLTIGAGKVTGSVSFAGESSKGTVGVTADMNVCGSNQPEPERIVATGGKLADVILRLEGTPKGTDPAAKPVEIVQQKCSYVPHVATVTVGTKLVAPNKDPVTHNVHGFLDDSDTFNANTIAGEKTSQKLDEVGLMKLKCDIHPWMAAYVLIADHPFHGVSGADGAFTLPAPPPGDYELVAWHEKLGEKRMKLTVGADGNAKADVAY